MKQELVTLFQDYGQISIIKKIKKSGHKRTDIYGYSFDPQNIIEKSITKDKYINFLIVDMDGWITMIYFGVEKKYLDTDDIFRQLNQVNINLLYGKFLADKDNDIYWEYSFALSKTKKEDILFIFKGFIDGLIELYNFKKG